MLPDGTIVVPIGTSDEEEDDIVEPDHRFEHDPENVYGSVKSLSDKYKVKLTVSTMVVHD